MAPPFEGVGDPAPGGKSLMTDLDNAPDALAQARIASGMRCVQRGDRRAARLWFAQAEQTDDPDTLVRLAAIYDRTLHDSGHAEACYRRAISHGSLVAMGNLGVLLLAQDRLEHAVCWLRRAAATGHVDALYHLARALDRRGDHDEALAPLRRAAQTGHPPAMCALGLHHYLHGHPHRARRWYRRARATPDLRTHDPLLLLELLLSRRTPRRAFRRG